MSTSNYILLVDDDPDQLKLLSMRLKSKGYEVETAASAQKALASYATRQPNLVITDLQMDGMDGMALFHALHELNPALPVIILTAHGTIPDAVDATQKGIFSYLTKPFDVQKLLECVAMALRVSGTSARNTDNNSSRDEWKRGIITQSPILNEVLSHARLVAEGDTSVLIQAPSGTGKELFARAIHRASPRFSGPFIAVNCSAIPEQLLESELFGHSKGSFTGATQSHEGLFRAASGGTLFLDEIGDMPLSFQAKLLRVLQEGEVRPVGSTQSHRVDARIISATHRILEEAVNDGNFRGDLYYRLNVVMLELPPLAYRREDIPLLANHFLSTLPDRTRRRVTGFSPEAMELLIAAPWPGNVRQLRNVVEQAVALSTAPIIPATLIQKALRDEPERIQSLAEAREGFERRYLVRLLRMTNGNVSQASRLAGRNRTEFYKLLQRHHLDAKSFRAAAE